MLSEKNYALTASMLQEGKEQSFNLLR